MATAGAGVEREKRKHPPTPSSSPRSAPASPAQIIRPAAEDAAETGRYHEDDGGGGGGSHGHSGSLSSRRRSSGDASAAAGRRVTRLRSRELGLEATTGAGEDVASDDPGPARKKGKVQPATKGAKGKAARADPPTPPPRPRLPPFPKSGDPMDFLKWDKEFRRICALPEPAGTVIPCTVRRKPTGPRTVSVTDIASVADNSMIRKASRSVVGISSRIPDGKEIMQCSGIVVDWNKTSRLATIVTCSAAVCFDGALVHPNPKVFKCSMWWGWVAIFL
ncbi:hypothetical protein DAI22_05g045800 [Oryza sativa Japonica Group]|nr:hypothetical protein DAI22_05g045800 [Oryza sativa Japonica Group]